MVENRPVADALAHLATADDNVLLRAAKARFSEAKSTRLETLHLRRQIDAWSSMEEREAEALTAEAATGLHPPHD